MLLLYAGCKVKPMKDLGCGVMPLKKVVQRLRDTRKLRDRLFPVGYFSKPY